MTTLRQHSLQPWVFCVFFFFRFLLDFTLLRTTISVRLNTLALPAGSKGTGEFILWLGVHVGSYTIIHSLTYITRAGLVHI